MNFVDRAVQKAGSLKALSIILGQDYQAIQYWHARGYCSSYKGSVALADYLNVPLREIVMERAETIERKG